MTRPVSRHASRQAALQVLYAIDVAEAGCGERPPAVEEGFQAVSDHFQLPEAARAFAKELVSGVMQNRDAIDERIARHARNWRLSRMAAVDRNVLRMATWELAWTDTPSAVVLDQAIELARRFGDDPSPGFVNGVLDAVAREIEAEAP